MASLSDLFTAVENGGPPIPTTASAVRIIGSNTLEAEALTNWPTVTKVHFVTGTPTTDTEGNPIINPATLCLWVGIVSGTQINDVTLIYSATGSDPGNSIGDVVEMAPDSAWAQDLFTGLTNQHDTQGNHTAVTATSVITTGIMTAGGLITANGGITVPSGQIITAPNTALLTLGAAFTAYTPTFTGITLGNGTVSAGYIQIGKAVTVRVLVSAGSTTTLPTGADSYISVPVTPRSGIYQVYSWLGGGSASWGGVPQCFVAFYNTTTVLLQTALVSGSLIKPGAFDTNNVGSISAGNTFFFQWTYETA